MSRALYLVVLTLVVAVPGPLHGQSDSDVEGAAHVLTRRSVRKAASIGGSKILECEINYPAETWTEHIITWRKQGIEVPIFIQFNGYPPHIDAGYQGRVRLVEQASIELKDIRIDDEGWFECTIVFLVDNEDTSTNGTWIYLSVNSPPVLGEVSPSFLIQQKGDTVDLFCEATGTPEPTLTWHKENKELVASERVTISGNRVQIKNLAREDGGIYMCQFKNVVGQTSHNIKLVVKDGDWIISRNVYIMEPPKNVTSKKGEKASMACQAEGYPNNITYQWYKNDINIHSISGLANRVNVYADGSFEITSLTKEDSGWYKCQPSNGLGSPPEASAYLNVTYLPQVLNMATRLYLPQGMLGRIECPVLANPPVNMIIWTKDDKTIDFSHSPRLKMNKQGTLIFKTVMMEDEGTYSCTPHSALGTGQSSTGVQVLVRDPPFFTMRPKPIYQRQASQQVTMPCHAEGDPKPVITWRKADGSFPSTTKTLRNDGNLTIVNLAEEDHGTYECVASNMVTSVITTALLIIEVNTPHAPYDVTVQTTQFTAKVSWLPAYDKGYPQHYVLWYRSKHEQNLGYKRKSAESTGDQWQTLRIVPDEATSVVVYRLRPDTAYEFTVLSRNRLGDGLFSGIVTDRTKGEDSPADSTNSGKPWTAAIVPSTPGNTGPPPKPPSNITIVQQKDSLKISWLQPDRFEDGVEEFKIQFRTVGQWVPLATVDSDETFYIWKTASRGAKYSFRIIAKTATADSDPSNPVTFHTGDPMNEGVRVSDGMIGGIVGGLLFLFVAAILAVLAVKIFNKRRQRAKALRYGEHCNVKYFGPKQMETTNNRKKGNHSGYSGNYDLAETACSYVTGQIDSCDIAEAAL